MILSLYKQRMGVAYMYKDLFHKVYYTDQQFSRTTIHNNMNARVKKNNQLPCIHGYARRN